jgi:hypothetical protein
MAAHLMERQLSCPIWNSLTVLETAELPSKIYSIF